MTQRDNHDRCCMEGQSQACQRIDAGVAEDYDEVRSHDKPSTSDLTAITQSSEGQVLL